MRVAIHTRLKPEGIAGYEQAHDTIPPAIPRLLRAAGCTGWTIWRNGVDLFHLVECEDWEALKAFLADKEEDQAWQRQVGAFRDFSLPGGDAPLPMIFELPEV
ncbi:MAG: L-rhamnose mutarotase [Catenulispora sp.]|nr:L-rhamnose mutarotase [Catenulispora sp.]